jgi:hypothetical protein
MSATGVLRKRLANVYCRPCVRCCDFHFAARRREGVEFRPNWGCTRKIYKISAAHPPSRSSLRQHQHRLSFLTGLTAAEFMDGAACRLVKYCAQMAPPALTFAPRPQAARRLSGLMRNTWSTQPTRESNADFQFSQQAGIYEM